MSNLHAVRIVNVDFYMTTPIQDLDVMYSDFRGSAIAQVPVIRIFGSTDSGKKICLHVHGVFPYLYVPFDGLEDINSLKYQIAANIDKVINVSFGQASSFSQHVYKISLVSGIPLYGYHTREHQFFKIFLYNPMLIRKVSNMLQNEMILGKLYQPHESHIPYILQFMIDYNLHGMSKILLTDLTFRNNGSHTSVPKQSSCELEADALCEHILNRLEVTKGNIAINPGIAALWEDEKQRLRNQNENSLISPCLTLVNTQVAPTKSHLLFKRALDERLIISENVAEKNVSDQNISVYPAETPQSTTMQNASLLDFHSPLSSDSTNLTLDLSTTLDDEAKELFEVLQDLGENAKNVDPDSILSQIDEDDDGDDYFDLSISLADTTPFKNILHENGDSNESADDAHDTTLIPQLDGQYDSDSNSGDEAGTVKNQKQKKPKTESKYRALPVFVPKTSKKSQENIPSPCTTNIKDHYENVKRKLNFQNKADLEVTVDENILECQLKQLHKENITNYKAPLNIQNIPKIIVSNTESHEQELSAAELYDLQTNYKAKEGSSKKLTQYSQTSDEMSNPSNSSQVELTQNSLYYNSDNTQNDNSQKVEQYPLHQQSSFKEHEDSTSSKQTSSQNIQISPDSLLYGSETSSGHNSEYSRPNHQNDSYTFLITPKLEPPSKEDVMNSLDELHIPQVIHQAPFYSNVEDVTGSVEVGHSVLKIPSKTTAHLEDFKAQFDGLDAYRKTVMPENVKWSYENVKGLKLSFCSVADCIVKPAKQPPSVEEVKEWLRKSNENTIKPPEETKMEKEKKKIYIPTSPGKGDESDLDLSLTLSLCENDSTSQNSDPISTKNIESDSKKRKNSSQRLNNSCRITGVSLNNTYGFKITPENYQKAKACNEYQYITVFSLELHIRTRGDLKPDPTYDPIRAVFYSVVEDNPESLNKSGIIAVEEAWMKNNQTGIFCDDSSDLIMVDSEESLVKEFTKLVHKWDPDILIGYETEMLSWGYMIDRARVLKTNLLYDLSRVTDRKINRINEEERSLNITGRIILDVWRLLRHEIALQSYTFENIVYHVLHQRVPSFSFKDLTAWWDDRSTLYRHRTVSYYQFRVGGVLKILDQLDLIGRTSELARLFGIQFFEVLSRGSQFRVESMMLRLAKPLNYIPVSPSPQQRAKMKAPEFLPLILEPESKLYVDPVIVLDFQSLYPSMIIAYNYCFSTCLGRVGHLGRNAPFEFGAGQLRVPRKTAQRLSDEDALNFSPCGVAFVKSHVRDGILPRMLREILETRLMVKNAMKKYKDDKLLQKVLHNRQLGLKLIANVTYGYTAANFSGRMPAVELGDSVVSKGRETLQRAIAMVETTPEWHAKVVYGDTDSLFVLVPGRSRREAFEIGRKIAEAVTNDNPDPVKLKLEKVYQPCVLQTKKRYVGYMYENAEQSEPVYDAKGIETVRRDGCPAVAKILEKCLRLLFETRDVSLVKKYVQRQFQKILTGRVSLQDLTFAKEYRGASRYRPGTCVPALELARKWLTVDKRSEPRKGERVPYVIASGPPGVPLIRLVRSPRDFLNDPSLRPNALYYITKVIIPPINRCFNLIGADLTGWFNQMPRKYFQYLPNTSPEKRNTISQYFASNSCAVCGEQTQTSLCTVCSKNVQRTFVILSERVRQWEQSHSDVNLICQSCTGIMDKAVCVSLDCPVLYRVNQTSRDLQQATYIRQVLDSLCDSENRQVASSQF